jgi:isopentenyl diphosphate isomerase/L-lactate dehydrogenase-like FMN-dependent dehydrogenase
MTMQVDFVTNQEIVLAARRRLTQGAWDQIVGGAESETTLRRNRLAFDRIAFRPRILVDVARIDTSTTFLGQRLRIPAILAPIGSLQSFHPVAALGVTRAATEFGALHAVSMGTEPAREETAAETSTPKIFQLYLHGDRAWTAALVERVNRAGHAALAVTVDAAVHSRRERVMLSRFVSPGSLSATQRTFKAQGTWATLDSIRALTDLPLALKGVQTPEDAASAVQHGVDIIWVSNHGGRQLDYALGALDVLPDVVAAVNGRAQVIFDGGILRGSDILKAVVLGADVVALGKLQVWALAAAGRAGIVRMLEILEDELRSTLGLLGTPSLRAATRAHICAAAPVASPHEMSAWPDLLDGRIL